MNPELKLRRNLIMKFQYDIMSNFNEEGQIITLTDIMQNIVKINNLEFLNKNKLVLNDVFNYLCETGVLHKINYLKDGKKSVEFQLTKYGKKFIDVFIKDTNENEEITDPELFEEIKKAYEKCGLDKN